MSDTADLVERARTGDHAAFADLYDRHARLVRAICFDSTAHLASAEDLSQEVFLRAFRGLKQFKGQSALGTWLYRISVNLCLNRVSVKRPISEPIDEQQFVDTKNEAPHEQVLRQERSALVRAAVSRLPNKQRSALVLRVFQDLSHQEISEALGISVRELDRRMSRPWDEQTAGA